MGGGGGIIGKVFSGIFGGGKPKAPTVQPVDRTPQKQTTDPNMGEAAAQARRRKAVVAKKKGRSALRIDLSSPNTQTRSGVSIRR